MCNNQFNISRSKGVARLKTFEEYFFLEEKLDAEDREKIKEDDWGIIIKDKDGNITEKAYPMPDAQHVISAARMYPFAKRKYDAKVVAELRRKIIAKAKEYNVPDSRIQSVIDDVPGGKSKPVKESVGPEDDTSGTSEFDESVDNDPDDCYTESDIFITEADKRFLSELKKKNDQLSKFELNRYGKTLIKNSSSGNLIIMLPPQPEKPSDKHVWEYFMMLIEPLRKYRNTIRYGSFNAIKWYKYDKCIRKFFNAVGLPYKDDRILCNIKVSPKGTKLLFKRHEYKTYPFNPSTHVLIHQSPKSNLTLLRPTHCSKDGVIYPKPRVYAVMRKLSNTSAFDDGISGGDFGDNFYVLDCKPMEVYHDMEYGAPTKESGDNTAVFINTTKPIKVIPLERFMKTEHISEAYDAITGEEIPIDHAYTMDEMREITLSFTEDVKPGKLMKVSPPDSKYVYFGSPENHMPEIKLDRPLFVTPYKSIASIFIWRDMELQNRIPRGSYNCQYEEWLKFNKKESGRCLKDVHVYVEGYPDLEPYEIKQTGYVHQILTHNWNDNYYRYPWMDASKEWLIVNDNGNVEFDDVTKCEITYHISGKPGFDKLGPRQDALESFVRKSIKLIHDKYKKDQIDPIGNQNCLLCTWCFEARMRGLDVLPRPVYSPRDDVLDISGNQIVFGSRQIKFKNYTDLASEITKAGDGCRFYVHVNWKDSKGGHEFIIMRISGKNFIIDPQQGKIEPLTKSNNYVSDINYDNSYIVQLSGKKFNRNLFDKWNDESTVLLWDPKRDIPYMLKEGMITKEEADKELRKYSTERFTSELKRELKNHHVQEGVIQNIKNKTSPFEKNLVYHISPEGHLDGQVFKPRVPGYLDKYDPSKTEFEDVETPRVCFSPSIEGCLNAIIVNIGRWKTANKLRDWYVYIPEKPLKEYKYRTTKQLVDEKKVYDANITKEIWIEEPVRLKQYGIIRIDSVTDKSRKKAVPTTLGEAKKRNVYDFKWHWLVKPKVLKDVPYDYSPLEVCKDMVADLERYKYGIPENGKIVKGSSKDYDTKWKLQSPEEFEKNGGGICYDYVEFEEGYLDAYGIKCKKYYMSTDLPGEDTHTFILVDDGHGGFVYPESSAGAIAGVHQVKNLDHACNIVADGFWKINDNLNKVKPEKDPNITKPLKKFKCYLWEYTGHPPYGSNMKQCTEYYSKGEPIKEWYQVEPNLGEQIKESYSPIHEFVNNFRNQGGHING